MANAVSHSRTYGPANATTAHNATNTVANDRADTASHTFPNWISHAIPHTASHAVANTATSNKSAITLANVHSDIIGTNLLARAHETTFQWANAAPHTRTDTIPDSCPIQRSHSHTHVCASHWADWAANAIADTATVKSANVCANTLFHAVADTNANCLCTRCRHELSNTDASVLANESSNAIALWGPNFATHTGTHNWIDTSTHVCAHIFTYWCLDGRANAWAVFAADAYTICGADTNTVRCAISQSDSKPDGWSDFEADVVSDLGADILAVTRTNNIPNTCTNKAANPQPYTMPNAESDTIPHDSTDTITHAVSYSVPYWISNASMHTMAHALADINFSSRSASPMPWRLTLSCGRKAAHGLIHDSLA
jgi:hypothetical protein